MISGKEKKKRQHEKELKSFRNKMGKNIVWFDSLTRTKQFDLLFQWKRKKYHNKLILPEKSFIRSILTKKWIEVTHYPPKLKHFITDTKKSRRFSINVVNIRQATLNLLFNKKK